MNLALYLFSGLGAGILVLIAWLLYRITGNGIEVDIVAFITVLIMAFRDVISKMGNIVRALNSQEIPERDEIE